MLLVTNSAQIIILIKKFCHRYAQQLGRVKRIWYLWPMRAAKVQASLRIRAVSPEPSLLAHTSTESRGTFRQKARSLAPLNGWACAVEICHDGMLEDTNSLDAAQLLYIYLSLLHKSCVTRYQQPCFNQQNYMYNKAIHVLLMHSFAVLRISILGPCLWGHHKN